MAESEPLAELIVTDSQGQTRTVSLPLGESIVGRNDDCFIRMPLSAKTVSRRHAKFTVAEGGAVSVEDLDSRCGTMVNGQIIRHHDLEHGDVVSIADYSLQVRFPDQEGKAEEGTGALLLQDEPEVAFRAELLAGDLERVGEATKRLTAEIAKRIVGQEAIVRAVWATILAKGHCLMIGVPGLAKTYMVTTFADALGLQFNRIQFTPDLMPSDIIGGNVIQEDEHGKRWFEFNQGPVFTQLLLADEINRTPPKTQAALLEAMQERQVTVAKKQLSLPSPFCVIASQNPIEQEGTYPLPEAQQDRFMLCLVLDYPARDDEIDILIRTTQGQKVRIDPIMNYQDILEYQNIVDQIAVSHEVAVYATDLVRATRPAAATGKLEFVKDMIDWGAGPRAGQSLIRAAKALAAMDGRPAIGRDDIREVALPVLRHRICCNYRARTEGLSEDDIIRRLLDQVRAG